MNVEIKLHSCVKASKKYLLVHKNRSDTTVDNTQFVIFDREAVDLIGFKYLVFNTRTLVIRRAGIDSIKIKTLSNNRITMPLNPDLIGNYILEKLDEEVFQLVKI